MKAIKSIVPRLRKVKVFMFFLGVLFPVLLIVVVALHLGFIGGANEFADPCKELSKEGSCGKKKGCMWEPTSERCKLDSQCTKVNAQQECSEGCAWDASIKRYNSNLYGLCVPLFED